MNPFLGQIRLGNWHVGEAERRLTDLGRLGDRLRSDLQRLEVDLVREREFVSASPEEPGPSHAAQLRDRRLKLLHSIGEVDEQLVQARDDLAAARSDLKKLELAATIVEQRERRRKACQPSVPGSHSLPGGRIVVK